MKKLLITALIILATSPTYVAADKPNVPYDEQPKHAKILCILAGIPVKYCHRKK